MPISISGQITATFVTFWTVRAFRAEVAFANRQMTVFVLSTRAEIAQGIDLEEVSQQTEILDKHPPIR